MDDGRLTYEEVAVRLGVTPRAARARAFRGRWSKMQGNDAMASSRTYEGWWDHSLIDERNERLVACGARRGHRCLGDGVPVRARLKRAPCSDWAAWPGPDANWACASFLGASGSGRRAHSNRSSGRFRSGAYPDARRVFALPILRMPLLGAGGYARLLEPSPPAR
jgi:hypothetical protein